MKETNMKQEKHLLGYLSGAPSVSTRPEASAAGPRSHILGLIEGFVDNNWEVFTFIVGDRVPINWIQSQSKDVVRKNYLSRLVADIIRIVMGFYHSQIAVKHIPEVDLIYERFGSFQSLGKKFQKRGTKWILETNGPFYVEASQQRKSMILSGLAKKIEIGAYKQCDVLVCVSNELKDIILQEISISPEKIIVLPNGVDTDFFSPKDGKKERYFNFPTIGYVGIVIERQGLDTIIKAIFELKKNKIDIGLVVIGDGPYKSELVSLCEELDLSDRVKFLGQINREMVPSKIDGFDIGYSGQKVIGNGLLGKMYHSPLKLYEYLAMEKPVIASAYDDAKFIISKNNLGWLFESGNTESLIDAISTALINEDDWRDIGVRARKIIVEEHSWKQRVDFLLKALEAKK